MFREFLSYLRQRVLVLPILFLFAAILIGAAALSGKAGFTELFLRLLYPLPLIVALRVWDDLADRLHDREFHPERITVHSRDLRALYAFVPFALGALLLVHLFAGQYGKAALLSGMAFLLLLLYSIRANNSFFRIVRNQFVLSKYPVILFLSSSGFTPGEFFSLSLLLYLALTLFDLRDRGGVFVSIPLSLLFGAVLLLYFSLAGVFLCEKIPG